jgi:archaeosine synthase beta-subunit
MPDASAIGTYPAAALARDRYVLDRRATRPAHDPWRHQGVLVEDERTADGRIASTATIFLTGRECPWRCVMCDLWKYTTETDTPAGAIPHQIGRALEELSLLPAALPSVLKLYNAGSFFDPRAVPVRDYDAIAERVRGAERVIVESHPALVNARVDLWLAALARNRASTRVEVAMGLETAHPAALERLHKRMTLDLFARAADALRRRQIDLRVFVLVHPPFVPAGERDEWVSRSVAFAFACGASAVTLIPSRPGNGALESLAEDGLFAPPALSDLERVFDAILAGAAGRVFADLWDIERLATCPSCAGRRRDRLQRMNLEQQLQPSVRCACASRGAA